MCKASIETARKSECLVVEAHVQGRLHRFELMQTPFQDSLGCIIEVSKAQLSNIIGL
jgi:hypothetical protein